MNHAQALLSLMSSQQDMKVQLLYLRLASGKVCVFVGAPIDPEEFDTIEGIALGECVSPVSLTLAAALDAGNMTQ